MEMTEREQFEAHWCRDVPAMFRVSALAEIKASRNEERYRRDEIQWAWEAWQAARATPTDHSDDAKPSTEQNWAKLDGAVAFHLIGKRSIWHTGLIELCGGGFALSALG